MKDPTPFYYFSPFPFFAPFLIVENKSHTSHFRVALFSSISAGGFSVTEGTKGAPGRPAALRLQMGRRSSSLPPKVCCRPVDRVAVGKPNAV